jgi:membrane-associated phospholipid phosphatase
MRRLLAGLVAAAAVVASGSAVRSGRSEAVDRPVRAGVERLRQGAAGEADPIVAVATDLGSVYGIAGVAAVLAATGRRRAALDVAAAGAIAWAVAQGAKPMLARERPYEADGVERLVAPPAGSSWPSGHAAVAAAMATALWPGLRTTGRLGVVKVAVLVGVSRAWVGVHHATDVIAGAGLGVLSGLAVRWARRR